MAVSKHKPIEPPAPGAVPLDPKSAAFAPALATLAKATPKAGGWFSEIKFDGYRMLADGTGRKLIIRSRNAIDWTAKLPELARDLAWICKRGAVLDGEVVAFRGDGVSSFELLKNALGEKRTGGLVYMVFDLLALDGWDLRRCRQDDRSDALQLLLGQHGSDRVLLSERQWDGAAAFHRAACQHGLEGIIVKRRDARYRAGRSDAWLKVKCGGRQEFVIVGFTDPAGARRGFGALLVGYHDAAGVLTYAGRVGSGYSTSFLTSFRRQLAAIERQAPTVKLPPGPLSRGVHWVEPQLVAEVRFAEWTKDAILRHPSFLGLREDKRAADVVREVGNS